MSKPTSESNNSSGVDKDGLWGWWYRGIQWKDDLYRRAAHKALDIPEDQEMEINVRNGISGRSLAAIVAAATIATGGAYLGGKWLDKEMAQQPVQRIEATTDYDVTVGMEVIPPEENKQ